MWLILCERGDASALWAYAGLRARGLSPIAVVSSDELGCALHVEHRLGRDGISSAITLARGLTVSSAALSGVINRMVGASLAATVGAGTHDREYANQELLALMLSWIAALPCPVLGIPTPQGLCGSWRLLSEWVWLAAAAGLATPAYRVSSSDPAEDESIVQLAATAALPGRDLLVVCGAVVGDAPPHVQAGAIALSQLAETEFLGVSFARDWSFCGATPLPDLRASGEDALDAIAAALGAHAPG